MKKIIFFSLLALTILSAKAQNVSVPAPVQQTYNSMYASTPSWQMANGNYIGSFTDNGKNKSATFLADGSWVKTEEIVPFASLSNIVQQEVNQRFLNGGTAHVLEESRLVTMPDGNYEAVKMAISNTPTHIVIYFNAQGVMAKRELSQ